MNDYNTKNTRMLVRKTCILLYLIYGPPVFGILVPNGEYQPALALLAEVLEGDGMRHVCADTIRTQRSAHSELPTAIRSNRAAGWRGYDVVS